MASLLVRSGTSVTFGLIVMLTASGLAAGAPAENPRLPVAAALSDEAVPAATADAPPPPRDPVDRLPASVDPFSLVSKQRLLGTIGELCSIQPHSGWRTSTTVGEAEARAWLMDQLYELRALRRMGLEIERQTFRTYLGVDMRESRLFLEVGGIESEVPANAPTGERENLALAMRFDSDGILNDHAPNPIDVSGPIVLIRSHEALDALTSGDVAGRVVFIDYAVVDRNLVARIEATARAKALLDLNPEGVVVVTRFSNVRGESHGTLAADLGVFTFVTDCPRPPVLNLRIEDLASIGISSWDDLGLVESARIVWDADIVSPGESANVIARIPGEDSSRAIILGAHLDSANTPGALDDGSGVVSLLEVARVLNDAWVRPPVDLYIAWFGSHERGLYGSSNFVSAHSDLLDRTLAMLQIDCLTHPLDGLGASLYLEVWSYARFGETHTPWPDFLADASADHGVEATTLVYLDLASDNASFAGSDVPNLNLIYLNPFAGTEVHYDGHLHDPYDAPDLVALEADALEAMARIALTAALQTAAAPRLRVSPPNDRRALFVASHTEGPHMSPVSLTDFGMTLAWERWDVDVVPHGTSLTATDLDGVGMVIVPPVHDYPSPEGNVGLVDEAWNEREIDAIVDWVGGGGLLVLANGSHRLKYHNQLLEENEDWDGLNPLAGRFGIEFTSGTLTGQVASTTGAHAIVQGVPSLVLAEGNGVPFDIDTGSILAYAGGRAVASVRYGGGEVIVLGDLGILGNASGEPRNLTFWRNLARYARSRTTKVGWRQE